MKQAWSIDSEQAVLGSMMLDNTVIDQCNVTPDDFFNARHRQICEAIFRLYARREPVDALTVYEELERSSNKSSIEFGLDFLAKLCRETAAPRNGAAYADVVRKHSQLRSAHAIGQQLMALESSEAIDDKIRALIELTQETKNHTCHIHEAMSDALDLLDKKTALTSTGLKDLDDALGGFHAGDLVVVGARPAMGKTAFMLNLALAATIPVGLISGEQGRDQIGMRVIAIDKSVSLHSMRTCTLNDDEWSRINAAMLASKSKNIWVYDRAAPSIDDIIRQARQWKYEKDMRILMVDYLQKITGGEGDTLRERIGNIAARLKDLARELNICVVALAQVKREVETRSMGTDGLGRMPYMADLAECGIIEQEADVVLTLYRPEVYSTEAQFQGVAYTHICKNRHGAIGFNPCVWRGEFLQFGDMAKNELSVVPDRWSPAA